MERQERVATALSKAIASLESAVNSLVKGGGDLKLDVWHAAAEAEHAIFLLSLNHNSEGSAWKNEYNHAGKVEVGPALTAAQDLLREAKKALEESSSEEAYKKAWVARGYLLAAHDLLRSGKRREM